MTPHGAAMTSYGALMTSSDVKMTSLRVVCGAPEGEPSAQGVDLWAESLESQETIKSLLISYLDIGSICS